MFIHSPLVLEALGVLVAPANIRKCCIYPYTDKYKSPHSMQNPQDPLNVTVH